MALHLELSAGDTLVVGGTRIKLEHKSGKRARLVIVGESPIECIKAGAPVPQSAGRAMQTVDQKPR
ncbi:hypothetical protein [Dyella japonica]|uniref:hypothetical protein n=1 Tax=Dyella japonica TaxID=231455 RepID=UPI00062D180C|nr:hypothetical protein [Dyella japonica]